MIGFASLRWPHDDDETAAQARTVYRGLMKAGWLFPIEEPGWAVLHAPVESSQPVVRRSSPTRIIVGPAFDRQATAAGRVADAATSLDGSRFEDACGHLVRRAWGAYVLLGIDPRDPHRVMAFRDPICRIDALHWTWRGVAIVTSAAETLLDLAPPEGLMIDWGTVRHLLRFPGAGCETLPVAGLNEIPSGCLFEADANGSRVTSLWSPAAVARRAAQRPEQSRETLPALVDACVAAWASTSRSAIAELSGGLDSAIVAAGLGLTPSLPIAGWFNYRVSDPESDERQFAGAVADHLGIPLTAVQCETPALDDALLDSLPVGLRPNIASVGLIHDQHLATQARGLGADALFTGHGGDAVFFQFPTPSLAADIVRARAPLGARIARLETLASWTDRSIWSLFGVAIRERLSRTPDPQPVQPIDFLAKTASDRPPRERWLMGAEDLPASKRLQILNLSAARSTFAGAWTAANLTLIHPLLSEPLIEHVLPMTALDLTEGRRDRALIRRAYARRLPDTLLARRGKGSLTKAYGRAVAAGVPFLRAYLLDGILAAHDILDLDLLDAWLDPERLMVEDAYTELLTLLFMEHWARVWSGRIERLRAGSPRP